MSECSQAKPVLAKFCKGLGLEIGAGGDKTVDSDSCITMDQVTPYTQVSDVPQILRGHCGDLSGFCDGVLDYIVQHHLLEDFDYQALTKIISEWRRVLKPGGVIVCNNPNQARFKAHIAISGQGDNLAHVESTFSLQTLKSEVFDKTGPWEVVFEDDNVPPYSFYLVMRKI